MDIEHLANRVIGMAIEVHRELGPGLLESTYETCLAHEITDHQIPFERQRPLPIRYKNILMECGYRLDLVIDSKLLLEIKSVESLEKIHEAQILTYMKLGNFPLGLLINFNAPTLKAGLRRFVI